MSLPRWGTLFMLAGGCGVAIGAVSLLANAHHGRLTSQTNFVVNAVDYLKKQPVTKELLGEELKVGKASLGEDWTKFNVMVRVPIKGELDSAYLYAYARRKEEKEKLRLYKLEATFSKIADKKLVLIDRTDQEDLEEEEEEPVSKEEEKKKAKEGEKTALAERKRLAELSPEEKKRLYIEQMKSWQPTR